MLALRRDAYLTPPRDSAATLLDEGRVRVSPSRVGKGVRSVLAHNIPSNPCIRLRSFRPLLYHKKKAFVG